MELKVKKFLELVKNNHFFVYDVETTGFDEKKCDAIEVSAIKVDGNSFEVIDSYDSFINPGYHLPQDIIDFNEEHETGITDEVIQSARTSDVVAKEFKEFLGENPIMVGHNAISFDTKFVQKLFNNNLGVAFEPSFQLDTLILAREKVRGSKKLGDLYVQTPEAHDVTLHKSCDDIKATLSVLKWLIPMFTETKEKTDNTPITVSNIARWTRSETLDRLYITNSNNASIYYDLVGQCWTLDGIDKKNVLNGIYLYLKNKKNIKVRTEEEIISAIMEVAESH